MKASLKSASQRKVERDESLPSKSKYSSPIASPLAPSSRPEYYSKSSVSPRSLSTKSSISNITSAIQAKKSEPKVDSQGVFDRLSQSHTCASIEKIVPQTVRTKISNSKLSSHYKSADVRSKTPELTRSRPSSRLSLNSTTSESAPPPYSPIVSRNNSVKSVSRPKTPVTRSNTISHHVSRFDDTASFASSTDDILITTGRTINAFFESPPVDIPKKESYSRSVRSNSSDSTRSHKSTSDWVESLPSPGFDNILNNHLSRYSPIPSSPKDEEEKRLAEKLEKKYEVLKRYTANLAENAEAALASTAADRSFDSTYSRKSEEHLKNTMLETKLRSTLANGDKILETNELELLKIEHEELVSEYQGVEQRNKQLTLQLEKLSAARTSSVDHLDQFNTSANISPGYPVESYEFEMSTPVPEYQPMSVPFMLELQSEVLKKVFGDNDTKALRNETEEAKLELEVRKLREELGEVKRQLSTNKKGKLLDPIDTTSVAKISDDFGFNAVEQEMKELLDEIPKTQKKKSKKKNGSALGTGFLLLP
ncbi:hypothetical protein HK098_003722 [Nowakowskiella sp. JEL0407]|nr:hypothetical protein HK098_003722 [Nowakowskiella sp. JEL0407]